MLVDRLVGLLLVFLDRAIGFAPGAEATGDMGDGGEAHALELLDTAGLGVRLRA